MFWWCGDIWSYISYFLCNSFSWCCFTRFLWYCHNLAVPLLTPCCYFLFNMERHRQSQKPLHLQVFMKILQPCKVAGLLTLGFAMLNILWHHYKFQFEFCVNLFECCEFWFQNIWNEDKTLQLHCKEKKGNLASTKTRKWVIVILHLPLQRFLTVTIKKLNWSITIKQLSRIYYLLLYIYI